MTDTVKLIIEIPKEKELIDKAIWYDVSDFDTEDLAIILTALKNGVPLDDVKALEQEPCEDAISRKAVLNTLEFCDKALDVDRTVESYKSLLVECYKMLPSVQPISKFVIEDIKADIAEFMTKIPALGNCKEGWHNAGQRIGLEQACEIIDNHIAERGDK